MFKFRKKNLLHIAGFLLPLLFFSIAAPALRIPLLNVLKYPLKLSALIGREIGGIIFYHRNLSENEKLKKEINLLKYRFNVSKEIHLENERLRKLLSFKQKSPYKVMAASVIAHSADNWSSVIIIDKGESSGIKRGFAVINYSGLAGRVIETSRSVSKIMLINDPNLGVSAIVQRSRQEGFVSGTLGNSLVMKYLPADADIKVSDTVITSGLTERYPKGLIIGTVIDVAEEFSGLSRYAIIKPSVDLLDLEEVLVIIP